MDAMQHLDATLTSLDGELTVGAGTLQDLLFELWSATRDTPAQAEVERWLTLTVERNLFSTDEVRDALTTIRDLAQPLAADSR